MIEPGDAQQQASPIGETTSEQERLWTPWRMRYIGGGAKADGCLFCQRFQERPDSGPLILHRGERAFVIMNLFPYNTGHLMIVPIDHIASPEEADAATMAEIAALLPPALRAARRALGCDGFNVGINVGAVAGAGIATHLHQHVVPRWEGDANFMPILASTMVLPELIPVTYAKLRGELTRELSGESRVTCVALADDDGRVLVQGAGDARLPVVAARPDEPLWRAALREIAGAGGAQSEIAGWAGSDDMAPPSLAFTLRVNTRNAATDSATASMRWLPVADALSSPDGALVASALANLAPTANDV